MSEQLIDFPAESGKRTRRWRFADRVESVEARCLADVIPALEEVERAAKRGLYAVGYVSYESGPAFDPALMVRPSSSLPLVRFELFDSVTEHDEPIEATHAGTTLSWHSDTTPDEYTTALQRIHDEIAAGRTYQANYTIRLTTEFNGDSRALYERLRRAQGGGYHAHLQFDAHEVLCLSPELFFQRRGDRMETRPMKGTRRRGRWREEDDALAAELHDSIKDRAENLMIVDLLRNDLGHIAETGSVQVPTLFEVERYRTVHQLTSTITANVPRKTTLTDLFRALFPCGSITGAPKISTMQLISELEHSPRGVYCGAVGVVEPGGDCTFAVPIRTLLIERATGRLTYGTGSGITADSEVAAERDEVAAKAAVLDTFWPKFELFETMRLENGAIVRLDRHLKRLFDSCAYFGFECDERHVRAELAKALYPTRSDRVRLFIAEDGSVNVTCGPLSDVVTPQNPVVAVAHSPVDCSDVFLYHKTTYRARYEAQLQQHADVFDVVLWNREGEVTEFTRGNIVVELDGRRVTPQRASGLLAGAFRAELLDSGEIEEQAITLDALRRASRVWFINSLREWVEVRLSPG